MPNTEDDARKSFLEFNPECRFEDDPLSRPEYLSVMVHFYRAEVSRSTQWRQRLDATTNWAVLTSAGMLSFVFATPKQPHILILLSNLIILAYLIIEARRFRYFEVYRARVRMLEENLLLPIITRRLESPISRWRDEVAQDLDHPRFKCTFVQALGFRIRQHYILIYGIMLGAWWLKLSIHPTVAISFDQVIQRARVGPIPPHLIILGGLLFYLGLVVLFAYGWKIHGGKPTDEIRGLQATLEDWKV
jgi:uncharacterized membrane protein